MASKSKIGRMLAKWPDPTYQNDKNVPYNHPAGKLKMSNRRKDYARICADCEHCKVNSLKQYVCHLPVDLVTGKSCPTMCTTSRAPSGHCGPDGQHYSQRGVVRKLEAAE